MLLYKEESGPEEYHPTQLERPVRRDGFVGRRRRNWVSGELARHFTQRWKRRSCLRRAELKVGHSPTSFRIYSSSSGEPPSFSPLCTFLCRRKLETTEKCRPQPSTSQANAKDNALVWDSFVCLLRLSFSALGGGNKLTLLASMAVHVRLKRRGTREALIADLALVLLLRV